MTLLVTRASAICPCFHMSIPIEFRTKRFPTIRTNEIPETIKLKLQVRTWKQVSNNNNYLLTRP